MVPYEQIDLTRVATIPIGKRKNKVRMSDFARPFDPSRSSFKQFLDSLPHILMAEELRDFAGDVVRARRKGRPFLVLLGAHVVKVGCSPLLIDLIERKIITAVGMNSAAAIHDVETAMWGCTSEDVEANIADGTFGMSRETGEFINGVLARDVRRDTIGYGEALGRALQRSRNRSKSILAVCYRLRVPVTVHAAIGTDIIHQQPSMNGAATGEMSFRDFKVLCAVVRDLRGGVVMNAGSAVVLPEVFLKAITVARNLGHSAKGFSSANFDMIQHYRSRLNVVQRPTMAGGRGYLFTGHHEIMIPLLCAMIKSVKASR